MILSVYVGDQTFPIEVPKLVLDEGDDFFSMIDRDLENGYQVSRTWIQKPTIVHRCQIAADRLLTALHTENQKTAIMLAGYILTRMPNVVGVRMDTTGDMLEHELIFGPHAV